MTNLIIITHGDFGAYLIEAAESIAGSQTDLIKNISISSKMSLEDVNAAVNKALEEMDKSKGVIFLTDMPGGTPMNVSLPAAINIEKSAVICGINISMMISAFANRKNIPFEQLVEKILADGRKAICEVKSILKK